VEAKEVEEVLPVLQLVTEEGEEAAVAEQHSTVHSLDMWMEYEFVTNQSQSQHCLFDLAVAVKVVEWCWTDGHFQTTLHEVSFPSKALQPSRRLQDACVRVQNDRLHLAASAYDADDDDADADHVHGGGGGGGDDGA